MVAMKRLCILVVALTMAVLPLYAMAEEPAGTSTGTAGESTGDDAAAAKKPVKKDSEKKAGDETPPQQQPAPEAEPLIPLISPPPVAQPGTQPAAPAAPAAVAPVPVTTPEAPAAVTPAPETAPETTAPQQPAEQQPAGVVPLAVPPAPAPETAPETPTAVAPAPETAPGTPAAVPPAPETTPETPAAVPPVPATTPEAPAPQQPTEQQPATQPAEQQPTGVVPLAVPPAPALETTPETPAAVAPAPETTPEAPAPQQPTEQQPATQPAEQQPTGVVPLAVPPAPAPETTPETPATPPAETPQPPTGFTFSDPAYGDVAPAPEVDSPATNVVAPGLHFEYGGTIRTRLGIDTSNEYVFVFDPLKKTDDPNRAYYTGTEDVVDWRSSVSFWTLLHFTPNLRARMELYLEYALLTRREADGNATILVNGSHPRSTFMADIHDAYLDWLDVAPGLDFRFGHQTVTFGLMDAHSVVERLSPSDTDALLWSDLTVPRKPIWAVRMDYTKDWFKASVVWQPVFTGTGLDLYGGDFSVLQPGIPLNSENAFPSPDVSMLLDPSKEATDDVVFLTTEDVMPYPQNSAAGVKLGVGISGFDAALTYSFAYDELPRISYDPEMLRLLGSLSENNYVQAAQILEGLRERLNNGETVDDLFSSTYERTHTLGLLLGYGVWRMNFKAELSWEFDRGYWASDYRAVTHDTLSYAAGLDFTWEQMVYLSLEVFGSKLFDIMPGERLLYVTDANFGVFGLLRLAFFQETLTIELVAESRINTRELAVSPRIGYQVVEDLELMVGAMFFECFDHEPAGFNRYNSNDDRKDTLFGRYSNNDQVYLMLKYSY